MLEKNQSPAVRRGLNVIEYCYLQLIIGISTERP
jgi:hypothetical protein